MRLWNVPEVAPSPKHSPKPPGVTPLSSVTGSAKPIVRGQYGRRLALHVDGLRLRSQNWAVDHAPELDPFTANRITVVRGASGVRYGPDAIGGAVLVEPPTLWATPGVTGEAHLLTLAGQGGSAAGRVQITPWSVPGLSAFVEGSVKRLASPSTPDYALDNTATSEANFGASIGFHRGPGRHQLSYRRHTAQLGVCSCLRIESLDDFFASVARAAPINSELYESRLEIARPYQSIVHHTVLARSSWQLAGATLTGRYGWQFDDREEFDVVRTAPGPQVDFRLFTHDAEVQLEHNPYHLNDHWHLRGSIGVLGTNQQHTFDSTQPRSLLPDYDSWTGGVYAIERLLGHDYEIEAGLRYDALTRQVRLRRGDFDRMVADGQISAEDCNSADPEFVPCRSTFHTLSASLGGLAQLTSRWSIKLDLSTVTRAPHPDEQYLNGKAPASPVFGLGDPSLGTETTYSASLTSAVVGDNISAEASVYANYIDDYMYTAPAFDGDGNLIAEPTIRGDVPVFSTRAVDATFYGVDGGLTYRPTSWLELAGQAAAVRARDRSNDTFLAFVPPDRLRGSVAYLFATSDNSDQFRLAVAGTAVAMQDRVDNDADLAPPPDGYFLLDAQMGWTTTLQQQRVTLAAHGTNLLNTRYRDYTSLLRYFADQPGTQVLLRLTVKFSSPTYN